MPVTKLSMKGTKNVYNVLRGGNCFRKYAFHMFCKSIIKHNKLSITQPAFTCSKLTIETLEQGVKYVQS